MQALFDNLLRGEPVWDFCCDHGYLGLSAYRSGYFPEVHFVDQVPHIIQKLKVRFDEKHFREAYPQRAFFWAQSGETVAATAGGTAVIAGVGMHTISDILQGIHEKNSLKFNRLILSSHNYEEKLEQFLETWEPFLRTYKRTSVCEVFENGRNRKLLIFDKIL
ncbi:MAG: tRNA (adenine(22)-N(1))-methyltransferase TrmK [Bdellovibrio sp.]|nr:tRNA (adenine(22)-N(1))-methyltransferase TrmK [Bdellovibrio sp.]